MNWTVLIFPIFANILILRNMSVLVVLFYWYENMLRLLLESVVYSST